MPTKPLFDKTILLHLRLPFSFFLMPVFMFALSQSGQPNYTKTVWAFLILHLLIYPASNAYNSYFDRDEGPIGGLEKPPPVDERLFWWAWGLDLLGMVLAWLCCGIAFALVLLVYSSISKAYSHPAIRLKRYAVLSWLVVGFFQGGFTYLAVYQTINQQPFSHVLAAQWLPALLASLNLWGFYPMTQIYQHDEDARRGDRTMSLLLGVRGTFGFTCLLFGLTSAGFGYFFYQTYHQWHWVLALYGMVLAPTVVFFGIWAWRSFVDSRQANFLNTMLLNLLGSVCLNLFFGVLWWVQAYVELF